MIFFAQVVDFSEREPRNGEYVCMRHECGGWLTGYWNIENRELQFNIHIRKDPWKHFEVTHFISLDNLPDFEN